MMVDGFAFFAIVGWILGACGASGAESRPYEHWMESVRRFSQNPVTLIICHHPGLHATGDATWMLDPTTMRIRALLAGASGIIFLACKLSEHRKMPPLGRR
jgi:hypothetical protein